jgi:hypothetical protein
MAGPAPSRSAPPTLEAVLRAARPTEAGPTPGGGSAPTMVRRHPRRWFVRGVAAAFLLVAGLGAGRFLSAPSAVGGETPWRHRIHDGRRRAGDTPVERWHVHPVGPVESPPHPGDPHGKGSLAGRLGFLRRSPRSGPALHRPHAIGRRGGPGDPVRSQGLGGGSPPGGGGGEGGPHGGRGPPRGGGEPDDHRGGRAGAPGGAGVGRVLPPRRNGRGAALQDTPLSLVAREMEERFGFHVEVDPRVGATTVTAAFSDEDPALVITAVCRVAAGPLRGGSGEEFGYDRGPDPWWSGRTPAGSGDVALPDPDRVQGRGGSVLQDRS